MAENWTDVVAPVLDAAQEALRAARATGAPRWNGKGAGAFAVRRADAVAQVAAAERRAQELMAAAAALDRAVAGAAREAAAGEGSSGPGGVVLPGLP